MQKNSSEIKKIKQNPMRIKRPDNQETFWMRHHLPLPVPVVELEIMSEINQNKQKISLVKRPDKLRDMLTPEEKT